MQESVNAKHLRRAAWLAGLLAAGFLALQIPHTLAIFTLAALIAFGVAPVTYRLERRMPRVVAIAIVYSVLLLTIAIVAVVVIPAAVTQAQSFLETMPLQIDHIQSGVDGFLRYVQGRFGRSFSPGLESVHELIYTRMQSLATLALGSLGAYVLNVITSLFIGISAIVLSAFFVSRSESIAASFRLLFPPTRRHLADEFEHEVARVFGGFVAGQVSLCILTGTMVWSALMLLHVPFAILIGVVTAIGYAVPFFGMVVVQVLAGLLAFPMGLSTFIWVSVIIFVIARIVDNVLAPKIMSESVGVSPIAVMFAVFAGGELFGITGLVLGIPAAAIVKTAWTVYQHARNDANLILEEVYDD